MSAQVHAPYEIARYLSDEAKRAAVALDYTPLLGFEHSLRRDRLGRCPLGACLDYMGLIGAGAPPASEVAEALNVGIELGVAVMDHAADFIADWESGRIADLAAALGVA
jgi:hypothetical protein